MRMRRVREMYMDRGRASPVRIIRTESWLQVQAARRLVLWPMLGAGASVATPSRRLTGSLGSAEILAKFCKLQVLRFLEKRSSSHHIIASRLFFRSDPRQSLSRPLRLRRHDDSLHPHRNLGRLCPAQVQGQEALEAHRRPRGGCHRRRCRWPVRFTQFCLHDSVTNPASLGSSSSSSRSSTAPPLPSRRPPLSPMARSLPCSPRFSTP
jgi:hypothetical protein